MIELVSPSLVAQNVETNSDAGPSERLCHARIGYRTITRDAVITASSSRDGWPAQALRSPMTYERWSPIGPGWAQFDAGKKVKVDYIGVAAHNLGSSSAVLTLQYSNDGAEWITLDKYQMANDHAFMRQFNAVYARYWRVLIDVQAYIGVIYLGVVLVMQRGAYGGHSPGSLSRVTEIMPNTSEGGQFLGRSIIRKGYATSYEWDYLTADWYRQYFDPFVESARRYPFFIQWFPKKYPDEVLYAWCNEDIQPSNMGTRDFMTVSFPVEALG